MNWLLQILKKIFGGNTYANPLQAPMSVNASTYAIKYGMMYKDVSIPQAKRDTLEWYTKRMISGKPRYEKVSQLLVGAVPWWVVAVLHAMECSCDFDKHLHNGDPLKKKTVNVPKGRPTADTWTWETSAVDALTRLNFHKITDWSIGNVLDHMERFNGLGYRNKKVNSPYLWSFTQFYQKGKYVSDGVYDPNAVSKQPGTAALLKSLEKYL